MPVVQASDGRGASPLWDELARVEHGVDAMPLGAVSVEVDGQAPG
jgi:hypothetical protein